MKGLKIKEQRRIRKEPAVILSRLTAWRHTWCGVQAIGGDLFIWIDRFKVLEVGNST
jgi:hypothetical protein